METIVILSDQQARYNDVLTERAVNKFLADLQPDILVNDGDLFEFEALSSFRKTLAAQQSVEKDRAAGRLVLERQRSALPNARIILVEGNHEERLTRFLLDQAPALADTPALHIPTYLGVSDYNVEYVGPYGAEFNWHSVLIYHGEAVSRHSSYSAKQEMENAGTSGVSGHTHRLGSHYKTDRESAHAWYENGCMCKIVGRGQPPSSKKFRQHNWQQGFTVGYWAARDLWNLYTVSITNHRFVWGGKLYGP
jgi:predicted phosphodiesterase